MERRGRQSNKPLKPTAKAFNKRVCFACHNEHAQDDNVFVQFYPVLRKVKEGDSTAAE